MKTLTFDFMSCFYYDREAGGFKSHKEEYKPCIEETSAKALIALKHPFSLLAGIKAERLFTDSLCELIPLSSHFHANLRVLNLRGFTELASVKVQRILKACSQLAHIDLAYCKLVDDECTGLIGELFRTKLISLVLRSCHTVTDEGIITMCENLSGAKEHRVLHPNPESDEDRYRELNKVDLTSHLAYLNIGDIKNLSNRSMKSISVNLMSSLEELCVWGNYKICNDGILDLCM